MKRRDLCALISLIALLFISAPANANPDWASIGLSFGADEPNGAGSPVTGAAGVLGTVNWNNSPVRTAARPIWLKTPSALPIQPPPA